MLSRVASRISIRRYCSTKPQNNGCSIKEISVVSSNMSDPKYFHLENQKYHESLGPIYRQEVGPSTDIIFISHPTMVEQVFRQDGPCPKFVLPLSWRLYCSRYGIKRGILFEEGDKWSNLRSTLNPLFLKRYKEVGNFVKQVCEENVERIVEVVNEGHEDIVLDNLIDRWSVCNVLGALFGESYRLHSEHLMGLIDEIVKANKRMLESSAKLQMYDVTDECRKETELWMDFKNSADEMLHCSYHISRALLNERHEGVANELYKTKELPANEIHRLTKDLIIAATDTTSMSTLWALYLLADRPDLQEKCRTSLKLISWCVKESMRMFPVAPFLTRVATKPIKINDNVVLPEGTNILMGLYTMGRNPNLYENPDDFEPDRWDRLIAQSVAIRRFSNLPFGFGARSCIGKRIAELGMHEFIFAMVKTFEMSRTEEVEYIMKLIGLPDRPVKLTLKKRI